MGTDMWPGSESTWCATPGTCGSCRWPSAGVVVITEMLEHAANWQAAMTGLIGVLAPGGALVITTLSEGPGITPIRVILAVPVPAMAAILGAAGLDVLRCEPDLENPGVFAKAPANHQAGGKPRRGGPPKRPPRRPAPAPRAELEGELMGILDYTPGGQFNPPPGTIPTLRCPDGTLLKYAVPDSVPLFSDLADACGHSFA